MNSSKPKQTHVHTLPTVYLHSNDIDVNAGEREMWNLSISIVHRIEMAMQNLVRYGALGSTLFVI